MVWVVKLGLYGGATVLLAVAGARTSIVVGFAVFSVVINALALIPPVSTTTL